MIDACNQNPCIHLSMALFYRWWSNDDKSCKQWRAEAKQETEQQKNAGLMESLGVHSMRER